MSDDVLLTMRSALRTAGALLALSFASLPAAAFDMAGDNTALRSGTLAGAGGSSISTALEPAIGGLQSSVGQSAVIGVIAGAQAELRSGFWHAVAVPEPGAAASWTAVLIGLAALATTRRRHGDHLGQHGEYQRGRRHLRPRWREHFGQHCDGQ